MSCIILDTTTYLKLSRGLHPILGRPVGVPPRNCVVLSEVDREFSAKASLAGTFYWITEVEYDKNRKSNLLTALTVGPQQVMDWRKQVSSWVTANRQGYRVLGLTPPSPADALLIAYGIALSEQNKGECTVVSDDKGVRHTIGELALCGVMSGWELLRLFHQAGLIDTAGVRQVYAYLEYLKELPFDWRQNSQSAFGFTL